MWKESKQIYVTLICPGWTNTNLSLTALMGDGSPQNKKDEPIVLMPFCLGKAFFVLGFNCIITHMYYRLYAIELKSKFFL